MYLEVNSKVHLTEIRATDRAALVEHLSDRAIYDLTLRLPYPYTPADADQWLELVETQAHEQGYPVNWAIRTAQEQLIGGLGFMDFQLGQTHRAEIGYWVARPFWNQGIMTAVVRTACAFAFREWGLVKIHAHVFVHNQASLRVLRKCDFEVEGHLKKHFLKDGRFLDAFLLARFR